MKLQTLTFLALSIGLLSFTFSKNKSYTPPGTVEISTNVFFDETEITNISWQEYMFWTERIYGKTSQQYITTIPDSTVWTNEHKDHYLSHPAYRDHPVVGISWQQAKAYCNWRSERVMEQITLNKEMKPNKTYPSKVTYRLPTSEEWERVANAGYSDKTSKKLHAKHADSPTSNFKSPNSSNTDVTAPVYQYWPNKFGVYNILGNVAEMVSDEGIAKGGSWNQLESEITMEGNFTYIKSENWIGFRCICEVEFTEI